MWRIGGWPVDKAENMNAIKAFLNWLTLADYEQAKEMNCVNIVARFSRGNVNVQDGQIMDEKDLRLISARGDRALAHLGSLRHGG
jgi:hypothetical protein